MESAVDVPFYRRGRLLQTVTLLHDAEHPGIGDITWDQLSQWLADIGKSQKPSGRPEDHSPSKGRRPASRAEDFTA